MKKGNSFTFFAGKGIYTYPNSKLDPIIAVYRKDEAVKIFENFTQALIKNSGSTRSVVLSGDSKRLCKMHGKIKIPKIAKGKRIDINFPNSFYLKDTRVSLSQTNTVDWEYIETFLDKQGYKLIKRINNDYISTLSADSVHIYAVIHDTFGVVAEGKGYSANQAIRSALSETIERCFSSGKERSDLIVGNEKALFKNMRTNCHIASGIRDTYSKKVCTEWIKAVEFTTGKNTFLPGELAFFNYSPKIIKVNLFSLNHTTGMATGSSMEEAAMNGIFEVAERDAYWIVMRCKINCPDINLVDIKDINPSTITLYKQLQKAGFEVTIKDMSLDWGFPIAHVAMKDKKGRIPCFSHGSGAGPTWSVAISRALAEVVQMYFGMKEFANIPDNWERVISVQGNLGVSTLAWSDPLFERHISHLFSPSKQVFHKNLKITGPEALLQLMKKKGYPVIAAPINHIHGLYVVRVYIPQATQPDERLERISPRLEECRKRLKLKSFYSDPILT